MGFGVWGLGFGVGVGFRVLFVLLHADHGLRLSFSVRSSCLSLGGWLLETCLRALRLGLNLLAV